MTEQEALEIVNSKSAAVSIKGMQDVIDTLAQSAADRGDNLECKTLGEYSYYEGQVNAFLIIKRLFEKLVVEQ